MGIADFVKNQFQSVIEFIDPTGLILIKKFEKPDNEIRQGSSVIVREGQVAIFISQGRLADVMAAGTYTLNTKNMPLLSDLKAFGSAFISPVKADVYFISLRQFIDNKWATKNPIMMRDPEFDMIRIRGFGKFSFHVSNVPLFFTKIFGAQHLMLTYDILQYLSSFVSETVAIGIGNSKMSALDLAVHYRDLASTMIQLANERAVDIGITFDSIVIENLSLPEEVEKMIDEQSGIGMAKRDMTTFMQYQTARAMRDAAKQQGGLAGLGAGAVIGKEIAQTMHDSKQPEKRTEQDKFTLIREYKALLDEGIITQEEFDQKKKETLNL